MFKKFITILLVIFFHAELANANLSVKARTAILQDYYSGEILFEKEPDISIFPASMTKIMTSIIAFDLIKSGDLKLNENHFSIMPLQFSYKMEFYPLIQMEPHLVSHFYNIFLPTT